MREIGARALGLQVPSNLLFVARGTHRARGPFGMAGLTAASASNSQEVDVYVALEDGAYLFDSRRHALVRVCTDDVRRLAFTPHQPLVYPITPVQLVFVVDLDKVEHTQGFEEPGSDGGSAPPSARSYVPQSGEPLSLRRVPSARVGEVDLPIDDLADQGEGGALPSPPRRMGGR